MVVLHTCKNEEDPIKNEDARVLIRLYVVFSEAQGQLTPKSAMEFCRNSNSSKLSRMSSIPARMKKIQLKTRIDVYETLCPQQMLVHKGGKIKNWGGECRDVTPTKSLSQNIRVDVNREVKFL